MPANGVCMDSWQRRRKWFFINACIGGYLYGLSFTAYYPTEYYYLIKMVKVDKPDIYYGLCWASLYFSGILTSLLGSYYTDRTKNVRQIVLLENVLNIVGNIMYALYYSPALILIGQLLVGTTAARATAVTGEISRIYIFNEISHKLTIMGIFGALGSLCGPCTTFVFQYIDFHIGHWKVNIGNAIGFVMTILYVMQLFLNYFTVYNVSKEYTVKVDEIVLLDEDDDNDETYNLVDFTKDRRNEERTFFKKYTLALKAIMKSRHIRFWYFLTFITTYARALIMIVIPIKLSEYLHWNEIDIALLWIAALCTGIIPTAITATVFSKYIEDFYQFLFGLLTLLLTLTFLFLLPLAKDTYSAAKTLAFIIAILLNISSFFFQIFSRSILAKFVPENIQAMSEGFRHAIYELSSLVAGLTVILASKYLSPSMLSLGLIISVCLAWYIEEHKSFTNITVIKVSR